MKDHKVNIMTDKLLTQLDKTQNATKRAWVAGIKLYEAIEKSDSDIPSWFLETGINHIYKRLTSIKIHTHWIEENLELAKKKAEKAKNEK